MSKHEKKTSSLLHYPVLVVFSPLAVNWVSAGRWLRVVFSSSL